MDLQLRRLSHKGWSFHFILPVSKEHFARPSTACVHFLSKIFLSYPSLTLFFFERQSINTFYPTYPTVTLQYVPHSAPVTSTEVPSQSCSLLTHTTQYCCLRPVRFIDKCHFILVSRRFYGRNSWMKGPGPNLTVKKLKRKKSVPVTAIQKLLYSAPLCSISKGINTFVARLLLLLLGCSP